MSAHGTHSRYTRGCRCADCRAANVEVHRLGRIRRRAAMEAGEVTPPHGTESTYMNYACRCADCRAAHADRAASRRRRRAAAS